MSNVRIKVANKIANIVEQRDFQIKRAKSRQLLRHLGLNKKAIAGVDASNVLNTAALYASSLPGLLTGTGVGTLAGAIGLAMKDKKDRKLRDYLTYLVGGAAVGGNAGLTYDLLRANSDLGSRLSAASKKISDLEDARHDPNDPLRFDANS